MFCKKQYFRAIWKFAFSLAAHWAFIFCLSCHLTPILLIAAKECWYHFEANECIFHLSLKKFALSWLAINQIERFRTYGRPCILSVLLLKVRWWFYTKGALLSTWKFKVSLHNKIKSAKMINNSIAEHFDLVFRMTH